jgi:hypothetical protein
VIRLTLIMLALIILIPAISILRNKFREIEKPWIIWIQNNLQFIGMLGRVNYTILSTDNCQIIMCCLFFYSDSLLAFKMALMFCIGQFMVMVIKFFYHEPHPYWLTRDIKFHEEMCNDLKLEYGLPSFMLFNLQFLWVYINYNYRYKYSLSRNRFVTYLLSLFYFYNMVSTQLLLIYYGWVYLYQSVLTYAIVFAYLRVIIYFDDDIMIFAEQLGFIKKSSRVMKFSMLFLAVACFIIA